NFFSATPWSGGSTEIASGTTATRTSSRQAAGDSGWRRGIRGRSPTGEHGPAGAGGVARSAGGRGPVRGRDGEDVVEGLALAGPGQKSCKEFTAGVWRTTASFWGWSTATQTGGRKAGCTPARPPPLVGRTLPCCVTSPA